MSEGKGDNPVHRIERKFRWSYLLEYRIESPEKVHEGLFVRIQDREKVEELSVKIQDREKVE